MHVEVIAVATVVGLLVACMHSKVYDSAARKGAQAWKAMSHSINISSGK